MADRLIVFEGQNVYRIGWYLEEEEDMGATLGELDVSDIPESEWDYKMAVKTIISLPDIEKDIYGFYWETKSQATKVLKIIKTATTTYKKSKGELPDWAKKALAAGWKPPKGWKP
jgi:hypothetical protein